MRHGRDQARQWSFHHHGQSGQYRAPLMLLASQLHRLLVRDQKWEGCRVHLSDRSGGQRYRHGPKLQGLTTFEAVTSLDWRVLRS